MRYPLPAWPGHAGRLLRYAAAALAAGALAALAVAPFAGSLTEQWARRMAETGLTAIAGSVRPRIEKELAAGDAAVLQETFNEIAGGKQVVAAGYCDGAGVLHYATRQWPDAVTCGNAARSRTAGFSWLRSGGEKLLAGAFPVAAGTGGGHAVVLQNLKPPARWTALVCLAAMAAVTALTGAAFGIHAAVSALTSRRPPPPAMAGASGGAVAEYGPLAKEFRQLFRQLDHLPVYGGHANWTAATIRTLVMAEFADAQVIVVSNREPYIHEHGRYGIELQRPASGLVSALEPVTRACGGTWIAHGSGSADREIADAGGRLRVPPDNPSYTLKRIWIGEEEQDGYYYGLANEGLWPLCHIAFVRPTFRETDWQMYRAINERFADAIADEAAAGGAPVVLIQDYHFGLLPRMVRERLPNATVITFWHIPWPNSETFGIFPWKQEIISGLLGSSILGFHTQFHCNNFIESVDRYIESRIDRDHASITHAGHETLIRPYPISIEWPPAGLAGQASVPECRETVRKRLGVAPETRLAVGIERFDYTKGILDRMHAVDAFLTAHPEWRGRFAFVQAAAPTRSRLPAYRGLQEEAQKLAAEINARHGNGGSLPVRLNVRHHEPPEIYELFRAADICLVSSLHDGMNLVAKEFVASRDDEQGVLVLSTFAGAAYELSEALMVNPYDPHTMASAIERALTMPPDEQRERMTLMREQVRSRNVYRWAGQMLLDASRLRKKQRVMQISAKQQRGKRGHA